MKKLTALLAICLAVTLLLGTAQYEPYRATGTAGSYTYTIYNAYKYDSTVITIKNTGSSTNDIDFSIVGYAHPDATDGYSVASGTLADDELASLEVSASYFKYVVTITETIESSKSTYEFSYNMRY